MIIVILAGPHGRAEAVPRPRRPQHPLRQVRQRRL